MSFEVGQLVKPSKSISSSSRWRGDDPGPRLLETTNLGTSDLRYVSPVGPTDYEGYMSDYWKEWSRRIIPNGSIMEIVGVSDDDVDINPWTVIDVKLPWHTTDSPAYGRSFVVDFTPLSPLELLAAEAG